MTFGERLKTARVGRGMSLAESAALLGVTEATVCKYENGKLRNPGYELIVKVSEVFGIALGEIMGWDCERPDEDIVILRRGGHGGALSLRAARYLRELLCE